MCVCTGDSQCSVCVVLYMTVRQTGRCKPQLCVCVWGWVGVWACRCTSDTHCNVCMCTGDSYCGVCVCVELYMTVRQTGRCKPQFVWVGVDVYQ